MAYLAAIRDGDTDAYKILACHINYWSLGGLGHRVFQLDVGLRLKAEYAFEVVKLAVPVGTNNDGCTDLAESIKSPRTAELIFSGPAPGTVVGIMRSERDERLSGKGFSLWTLTLARAIQPGQEVYVRARFAVVDRGRTWSWKRWLFATNGALVDLRVAETREQVNLTQWQALKDSIVPIEELNVFVMAPQTLQLVTASPSPRYVRLLEGDAWGEYIGRSPDLFRTGKMIVYYWRQNAEDGHRVDTDTPFRGFLDLSKESLLTPGRNHPCLFLAFPIL